MTDSLHPALVIGGGSSNGLGIAQNLGRRGIPVYCVTSDPYELMRYSKYCSGFAVIPHVESDAAVLERVLDAMYHHVGADCVLFPTTDTAVLRLAQLRPQLQHHVCVLPDPDVVRDMVIKTHFYRSLDASGIPYPNTVYPDELSFTELVRTVSFPVYVRPAQTLIFSQYFRGKGFVAHTPRELQQYLHIAQNHEVKVMVQEIIDGPTCSGYSVKGYFNQRGDLTILITKQKIWQPTLFSNPCVSVTIPHDQATDFTPAFLKYMTHRRYRGLFGAEFKRDARDGSVKLLEVNPRSTGDSCHGRACGADDIYAAYLDAIGKDIHINDTYHPGVHWINEFMSVWTIATHIRHGQWTLFHNVGTILSNKYLKHFAYDDPHPASMKLIHTLQDILRLLMSRN